MGKLHLIGGEKGGVGKSFTARLIAQYLIDGELPFIGFDSDQSHSTFSRFYSEYTSAVDVSTYESLDAIIDAAESDPEMNIVVDLAAQTFDRLNQWLVESDGFALFEELGFTTYYWHIMDDGADSSYLLDKMLDRLDGEKVEFVVVENLGRGEDFTLFEQSPVFAKAQTYGVSLVKIPKLHPHLAQKIDFSNTSFWAAANNRQIMSTVERHRVKTWIKGIYEQFKLVMGSSTVPFGDDGTNNSVTSANATEVADEEIVENEFAF